MTSSRGWLCRVFVACLVLGACSDDDTGKRAEPTTTSKKNRGIGTVPVGLRQTASGQAEVILPNCRNYALWSMTLGPRAPEGGFAGEASWAIHARKPRKVPRPASVVLGEAPQGFTEPQPLIARLAQDQPLAAVLIFKWTKGKRLTRWGFLDNFSINTLPVGDAVLVVFGGAESEGVVSIPEFQERAAEGKCKDWHDETRPERTKALPAATLSARSGS